MDSKVPEEYKMLDIPVKKLDSNKEEHQYNPYEEAYDGMEVETQLETIAS